MNLGRAWSEILHGVGRRGVDQRTIVGVKALSSGVPSPARRPHKP